MATEIDGFAVFAAMGAHADLFTAVRAEAAKAARAAAAKQIKVRTLPLDGLRRIRAALGAEAFGLIVGGMKEAEIKSLATRLDRHNASVKAMPATERLRHLLALADETAPAEKPARAVRSAKSTKSAGSGKSDAPSGAVPGRASPTRTATQPERTLSSAAMAAKPPRRKAQAAD